MLKVGGLRVLLTRSACGSYCSPSDRVKTRRGVFLTFPHMALAPVCFPFASYERRGQTLLRWGTTFAAAAIASTRS